MFGSVSQLGKTKGVNEKNVSFVRGLKDSVLIDSGAQACVCPKDYAPEIPLLPVSRRVALTTVIGTPIK
eukprot:8867335-Lingulodinium_polyedra.AAC.1